MGRTIRKAQGICFPKQWFFSILPGTGATGGREEIRGALDATASVLRLPK